MYWFRCINFNGFDVIVFEISQNMLTAIHILDEELECFVDLICKTHTLCKTVLHLIVLSYTLTVLVRFLHVESKYITKLIEGNA